MVVLQVVLAGIFLWSAVTKFADVYTFGQILRSYGLLPEGLIKPLAILLPFAELVIGLALLIRPVVRYAALGVILLSLAFGLGLALNWGTLLPYGCGCFGPTEAQTVGFLDVGKDALLLLAGVALYVLAGRR